MSFHTPEKYRMNEMGPAHFLGNNGAFLVPVKVKVGSKEFPPYFLRVMCSDGQGWEHVSVSLEDRCPTWEEMCLVKGLFWDCVVQFHPPKSQYVNCHPYCLHMWRKVGSEFETPPTFLVGPKS